MTAFLIRRSLRAVLTLAFVVTLVFVATRLSGDPTVWLLPDDAPPDAVENLRRALGVDQPIHVQFARYVRGLSQGDFGSSFAERRPVTDVVLERLPATLQLGGLAFLMSIIIGVPVGIAAALSRNGFLDRTLMTFSFAAYSIPTFVMGILFILLFSLVLRWLPSGGYGGFRYFIMPVVTLGAAHTALISRLTRSSLLEVIGEDYIRTGRAKGLGERTLVWKHAMRNALLPVVTIVGLSLATLVAGAVVTETVFAWPGVGRLILASALRRDYPTLQFVVFLVTATIVVINIIVDLSYSLLDPRIRVAN